MYFVDSIQLIATREEESLKRANEMIDRKLEEEKRVNEQLKVMMSGDISFSYPYNPATFDINPYLVKFRDTIDSLKDITDWALVFTRENNFGKDKGIQIHGRKVIIKNIDGTFLEYEKG